MKIVSTGKTISTTEYLNKKHKARRKRRAVYLALSVLLLGVLVYVLRLEKFRIKTVIVAGTQVVSTDVVEAEVREALSGYYFWLVPRDSSLLYRKQGVRRELQYSFPRLSAMAISLEGLNTLNVLVSEREPYALYCTDEASPCYFLDETGFIFGLAPSFSEGVYFIYSTKEPIAEPLRQHFLPPAEFAELIRMVSNLPALSLEPLKVEMSENDFTVFLKTGASVLWQREGDFARILSNLESFLTSPTIKGQRGFLDRVSVLDLRTEDKVFYTFKK